MRMIRYARLGTAVITLALLAALPLTVAQAASGTQNIALSPSSTQLTIQPGASVTKAIVVLNDGTAPFAINATVEPYHVKGDTYDPQFTQLPGTVNAAKWVTLSKTHVASLVPHKTASIPYTVSVPTGTAPGGYYAVVFAQTAPEASSDNSGVQATSRVGDILYITVAGPVKQSGSLASVPAPGFIVGTSIPINTKVSNTGGVHFLSTLTTDAHDRAGKLVFHSSLERYILPQTTRLIAQSWAPSSLAGIYKISRSATVAGQPQSLPDESVLFVKPQLFPIAGFLLLTLIGIFIVLRQLRRRK